MRFAPIVPYSMLGYLRTDYNMVLTPQLQASSAYANYFTSSLSGFKILDNGAAEGRLQGTEEIIGWAHAIKADEVIAPDVMHNTVESLILLRRFCRHVPSLKIMAVLQATTWLEFDIILNQALDLNVQTVALPKLLCKHLGDDARLVAAEKIREKSSIQIHCLGCSADIREVKYLARQDIVRGIDSSSPVVMGLLGQSIREAYDWETSHSKVDNFWNQQSTPLVEENLDVFRRWCEAPTSISQV